MERIVNKLDIGQTPIFMYLDEDVASFSLSLACCL